MTAGYAIRYADELNYVFLDAPEIAERMASVRARCEAEGRDPATLRFSLYTRDEDMREPGQARVDLSPGSPRSGSTGSSASRPAGRRRLEAQAAFAEDCRAAGVTLAELEGRAVAFGRGRIPRDPPDPAQRRVAEPGTPDEQLDRDRPVDP